MNNISQERISSVSKNYAQALIEVATEKNIPLTKVLSDLDVISDVFSMSEELCKVLQNPSVNDDTKKSIIQDIFADKILAELVNFLYILIDRKRIGDFNQICSEFINRTHKINNIQPITIISAIELQQEQKDRIIVKLSEKLHKVIQPQWQVNSDIVAGLIIKISDNILDMSIKNRIESISKSLLLNSK